MIDKPYDFNFVFLRILKLRLEGALDPVSSNKKHSDKEIITGKITLIQAICAPRHFSRQGRNTFGFLFRFSCLFMEIALICAYCLPVVQLFFQEYTHEMAFMVSSLLICKKKGCCRDQQVWRRKLKLDFTIYAIVEVDLCK